MNTQFYTPTFGYELYDNDNEYTEGNSAYIQSQSGQSDQSTRMPNLEQSLQYENADELSDEDCIITAVFPKTNISEPAKPNSPYALFFRDTVNAIKDANPNLTYEEISNIVSEMWEALDPKLKSLYLKKTEQAHAEYRIKMEAYRRAVADLERQKSLDQQHFMSQHQPLQTKPAVFTINPLVTADNSIRNASYAVCSNSLNNYNAYNDNDVLPTLETQPYRQQSQLSDQELQTKPATFTIPYTNENHYSNYGSNQMLATMDQHQQLQSLQQQHYNQHQQNEHRHALVTPHAMQPHQHQHGHYQKSLEVTQFLTKSTGEMVQTSLVSKPLEETQHQQQLLSDNQFDKQQTSMQLQLNQQRQERQQLMQQHACKLNQEQESQVELQHKQTITSAAAQTMVDENVKPSQQIPLMSNDNSTQKCIRDGCNNLGINSSDWENEYCSNECVVAHCRDAFHQWVKENKNEPAAKN